MKIEFDKKLFKYGVYVTLTAIAIYISFSILFNIGSIITTTFSIIRSLLNLIKPLLIAIVIAYLLYPVTKAIENFLKCNKIFKIKSQSINRVISIILSYLLILGLILGLLCGIYFMIGGQLSKNTTITNIFEEIYTYLSNTSFTTESINAKLQSLNLPLLDSLEPHIINTITYIQKYITSNLGNMTSYLMSIGSGIASFFIALIISIYLLKDSEYFLDLWSKLYHLIFKESKVGSGIKYVFTVINEVFGKFLRGQLLEAFCVGILSAIALSIIGIDYAVVIGVIAGICNLIPYVGPIVGTILAAIMGLLSGTPIKILYAIIAMLVVQQLDNNLLAPKIVGDSVGLHAVFTMMAILVGGSIGGLLGMLLAVPLAASFRVLFNNWYNDYIIKNSSNK